MAATKSKKSPAPVEAPKPQQAPAVKPVKKEVKSELDILQAQQAKVYNSILSQILRAK